MRHTLTALVEKWRAKAAQVDAFHATMGTGYWVCAQELADTLSALGGTPTCVSYPDNTEGFR